MAAMKDKRRLLMIVYSLDTNHPIFGHQAILASEIAKLTPNAHFLSIYSSDPRTFSDKGSFQNFPTSCVGWQEGSLVLNLIRFMHVFLAAMIKTKPNLVFCHMVDSHAALIAPLLYLLRKPHYIWYAHKTKSFALVISSFFCTAILTSTKNSCPIKSKKVKTIGQSIDSRQFSPRKQFLPIMKAIHIGRLDDSKRIDHLARQVVKAIDSKLISSMSFYGDFSSKSQVRHMQPKLARLSKEIPWFENSLKGPIPRSLVPRTLETHDVFIHGFLGSLDKVLIESTLTKVPVVTENKEYLDEFGLWPGCTLESSISEQLEIVVRLTESELKAIVDKRYKYALENHSLDSWLKQFFSCLNRPR